MNDQEIRDRALSAAIELMRGWNAADLLKEARLIEQYLRCSVEGVPAQTIVHMSDCVLHNGPALPPQACDCQPNDLNVR